MSYERSPSLGGSSGYDASSGRKGGFLWGVVAVLAISMVGLLIFSCLKSGALDTLRGSGGVIGQVVDEAGRSIPAEILIFGTDIKVQTDERGYFRMEGIPEGERTLVVGCQSTAWEYPVVIIPGSVVDVGKVFIRTTAIP